MTLNAIKNSQDALLEALRAIKADLESFKPCEVDEGDDRIPPEVSEVFFCHLFVYMKTFISIHDLSSKIICLTTAYR